jgi:rhomboid protease GluP
MNTETSSPDEAVRVGHQTMREDGLHPLEQILRMCAAAAPEPWYPRLYAKQAEVDTRELGQCLEELWLSGLIERSRGTEETGPAIQLTRAGERVLMDPEALERLRQGQPVSREDRSALLRQALQGRLRPHVTRLLLVLNLLVFAAGYFFADQQKLGRDYLRGSPVTPQLVALLERCGALAPIHLIAGQWWRLFTAGFVHGNFLHLLLNMVWLYLVGRFVERLWGHLRFLTIYLVALLGSTCLGVAHFAPHEELIMGASGAVLGLFAAEAVWLLLNRRYLPRDLRQQARANLLMNLVLLVFIALFPAGSGWGHMSGAAAGALAAFLLQLHRFGPANWRWLALAGFAPLIWYGDYAIKQARMTNEKWQEAENSYFEKHIYPLIHQAMKQVSASYEEDVKPLLETHPIRRNARKVDKAVALLTEQQQELNALAEQLQHAGPFGSPEAEDARQTGRAYVLAMTQLQETAERVLLLGEKRSDKDRQAVREKEEQFLEARQKWNDLFQ